MNEAKNKSDKGKPNTTLTRRELLVSLGAAAVISGFQDVPGQTPDSPVPSAQLPPGLYSPSIDHLTHALRSDGPFLAISPAAETEYRRPTLGPYVPQGFTAEEFLLIQRLVEIILGEDLENSPSHSVDGPQHSIYSECAEWIDLVTASAPAVRRTARNLAADHRSLAVAYFGSEDPLRQLETFEPERVCREGLVWLGEESHHRFGKAFLDAGRANQITLVQAISDARPDKSAVNAGTRLFEFLKAECVRGFYTSRLGLKELEYKGNSFYAESPGCGPLPGAGIKESQ